MGPRSFGCVLLAVLFAASEAQAAVDATQATAAFSSLQKLVGDWEGKTTRGSVVGVSFRLVAAQSVLVETFNTRSDSQTLTVFHLDGPRLLATHYCAQRNQPRLRLADATPEGRLSFEFLDATNLGEKASHLHRLELELVDADHFRMLETYATGGASDATLWSFARAAQAAGAKANGPAPPSASPR